MLLEEREQIILTNINSNGTATVRQLAEACEVTAVTIRRDLKRLEDNNLIKRTFGGAVSLEMGNKPTSVPTEQLDAHPSLPNADALIITPARTRDAHTLRERAIRQNIPLIAEGTPQDDAVYLGIDNYGAGYSLGEWTGEYFRKHHRGKAYLLDIGFPSMSSTTLRSTGFQEGLSSSLEETIIPLSIDGGGSYDRAYHIALDALRIRPEINIIFGINDNSILAAIQAYIDLGRDLTMLVAVTIGGEGNTILDALHGPLTACMVMFPEIVGYLAIDTILYLWNDNQSDFDVITPTAILTAENVNEYYVKHQNEWQFINTELINLIEYPWKTTTIETQHLKDKHISFSINFRTHEWYQNLAKAMQTRAKEVGVNFSVVDVNEDVRAEVRELRRVIGKVAASYIKEGDTIILDAGTTTMNMTQFMKQHRNITVITNSPDIMERLRSNPDIKLILAGGEFDHEVQAFVGRYVHMLLREMRVDKAFIVAGGVSASFGLSSLDSHEAEVRRYMIDAAREVIILADHTVLDIDSDFHVTDIENIDTMITDMGILSTQKLEYVDLGMKLIIAGQVPSLTD
jgi:DeoR/GlpR family transcriptional regulator of sugar metabolism